MGRGAITRGAAPVTAYLHTKIIPLNFSPSLKPEEEGNKRGKRREKLKMNELAICAIKLQHRSRRRLWEQGEGKWTSGTTTKGNFWRISSPQVSPPFLFSPFPSPSFLFPVLCACLRRRFKKDRPGRLKGRRFDSSRGNFARENGIGRMLLEIGNCESEMCCAMAISVLVSRTGIFPTRCRTFLSLSFSLSLSRHLQFRACTKWRGGSTTKLLAVI